MGPSKTMTLLKIWRSPRSRFGEGSKAAPDADLADETITAETAYTDAELKRIASEGFNGIWVFGVLRHIVSVEPFPELGCNSARHLAALKHLISRAEAHGLKVWLHMQPPRAVPVSWAHFWERHPEVGGEETVMDGFVGEAPVAFRSLCTSTQPVKDWLVNASAALARELPGLGGVIIISASEFNSHCYTHRTRYKTEEYLPEIKCPRCREREPEDVAAEVLELLAKGIHSVTPALPVVAWNWSWCWRPDSNARVIERLPKDVLILADFERGGIKDIPGGKRNHTYDEYSLGYAGPSQRFLVCYEAAKNRGLRMMAKLQIGTTHELGSVVNLPIIGNLFEKARFIRKENLAGFMGCWNFGNHPSANTAAVHYFLALDSAVDKADALERFAADYFTPCDATLMRLAWDQFAKAMEYFPFTIAFLYHGAHSHTLAYHQIYRMAALTGKPAGRSWMPDERGDDLDNSFNLHHTQFTLDDIIERVGKLAVAWQAGVSLMREALRGSDGDRAKTELGNATLCGAIWRSTENTYKIYRLRKNWSDACIKAFQEIASDELEILGEALPFVAQDRRQGVHLEPQAEMFNPATICEKMQVLNALIISRPTK